MVERSIIQKIVEAGGCAPSGDNSQPWKFTVSGSTIEVFSTPEKDNPIFNYRSRGTILAHGALLENMLIAARSLGYGTGVAAFPDPARKDLTLRLVLEPASVEPDPLYPFITKRATNRKKYKNIPLSYAQRKEITDSVSEAGGGGELKLIEDRAEMERAGRLLSVNEIVMLGHRELHRHFFRDIVWSEEEERRARSGLYVKTMELAPPQLAIFKLLRRWPVARVAAFLGLPSFIAKENSKIYGSGALLGAILIPDDDKEFLAAGRLTQRIWLASTRMGRSMQLVSGILYLGQRVEAGEAEMFSPKQRKLIANAYTELNDIFNVSGKVMAMVFRIGEGGEPSGRSSRMPPDIRFL